jgi:hypothetical protein
MMGAGYRAKQTMINYRGPEGEWQPYFTWKPVRIRRRWYWLTTIYRREKNRVVWPPQGWEFGNANDFIIDRIKNP